MTSTVITQGRSPGRTSAKSVSLIPQSKFDEIIRLDSILQESRIQIQQASPMAKAFITAAAMKELENAITDNMMADIMNLMDSPLGFKTDRRPGTTKRVKKNDKWVEERVEPYAKQTIKRCVIVALLAGAQLSGNEFNILVGQTYFTKEFMQRAVLAFPGINNFRMEIGAPVKHGDKTAALDARATWRIGNEPHQLECRKTDVGDMRIIVNAYESSGVDQLRGLAESKLLRRVFQALTGIKSYEPDEVEDDQSEPAIEGKLQSPIRIDHQADANSADEQQETAQPIDQSVTNEPQEPEEKSEFEGFIYNFPNAEAVLYFVHGSTQKIQESKTVELGAKMVGQCLAELDQADFSPNGKKFATDEIKKRNPTAFAMYRGKSK